MHSIEPYFNWREFYTAEEDPRSPFYGNEYSEFEFTNALYDHLIHPQWDQFGSPSLFVKVLYANYNEGIVILELFGEWNDCLHNDIMFLKRDLADHFIGLGIDKFILIGENVLNFHYSDDCYYEEWFEDISETDGWIALVNFRDHVLKEFDEVGADNYFVLGGRLQEVNWRTKKPTKVADSISGYVQKRLELF
ncbi:hypothetical protein O3Q51_01730 [Cryomorphaceae bacterium 1068]|nr:hypothetical protein [Cryomorphaceae bacterium 1068]